MSLTNFAGLTPDQKTVWSREVWSAARDQMFINRFLGEGNGAMIQRIVELTRTERGERVLMQLVADLIGDGVIGDNEREGMEEELKSYSQIIHIDLIANAVRNKGKLAEQKNVIQFREQARDKLAYWLANRIDQLAFLTLSGIPFTYRNDGGPRTSTAFAGLSFAADVQAPTAHRHFRWDGVNKALTAGQTTDCVAADTLTYGALVDLKAYADAHYVKPLSANGRDYYVLLVRPETMASLKKDETFQRAVTMAAPRGEDNPWFTGATITIDGLVVHPHRLVFNTTGAASGAKWGATGQVEGSRTLLCGAQALGIADISPPEWYEKEFEYGSSQGINVDKMFGLLKPRFYSNYDQGVEDFGVIAVDHAIH